MNKIAVISIWSPDVEVTARFYQQAVGLPLLPHHPSRPHFKLDETILVILNGTPCPAENPQPERFPLFAITVPDLDEAVERLQRHQVTLPWGIESNSDQRWVMFHDPAGNLVEFVQSLDKSEQSSPLTPFFADYLEKTRSLHEQVKMALSNLPQTALDWSTAEGENSLAVLTVHIAGANRFWFSDVISCVSSRRDREAEFQTANQTYSAIIQNLDQSLELIQHVLSQFTIQDLNSTRISPRDGKPYSVGWAMLHILEHTALHLGHMQITRQLWEARDDTT
ncbi:MAG: hypothetical protein A2Z16_16570 [Chloroflexi bacterium RBG_16_54_18]|nr:MAG: hypothetical protein A2Z16_16570 [Chloroflexi bacterium RBG_16_54_18]